VNQYSIELERNNKKLTLAVQSNDTAHVQAQAVDICRAVDATQYSISYEHIEESPLAKLFRDLAFNNFKYTECSNWDGSFSNKQPCFYVLGKRVYVRYSILLYLDIPKDNYYPKPRCGNPNCVNPLHFDYKTAKHSKLSPGDIEILKAQRREGASVNQIAKILNVHRATIYRHLQEVA
jgi:hypothetical protein